MKKGDGKVIPLIFCVWQHPDRLAVFLKRYKRNRPDVDIVFESQDITEATEIMLRLRLEAAEVRKKLRRWRRQLQRLRDIRPLSCYQGVTSSYRKQLQNSKPVFDSRKIIEERLAELRA